MAYGHVRAPETHAVRIAPGRAPEIIAQVRNQRLAGIASDGTMLFAHRGRAMVLVTPESYAGRAEPVSIPAPEVSHHSDIFFGAANMRRRNALADNGDIYVPDASGGVMRLRHGKLERPIPPFSEESRDHTLFAYNARGDILSYSGLRSGNSLRFFCSLTETVEATPYSGEPLRGMALDSDGNAFLSVGRAVWRRDRATGNMFPILSEGFVLGEDRVERALFNTEAIGQEGDLFARVRYESGRSAVVRISRSDGKPETAPLHEAPVTGSARRKKASKETANGLPAHSFDTLPDDLVPRHASNVGSS